MFFDKKIDNLKRVGSSIVVGSAVFGGTFTSAGNVSANRFVSWFQNSYIFNLMKKAFLALFLRFGAHSISPFQKVFCVSDKMIRPQNIPSKAPSGFYELTKFEGSCIKMSKALLESILSAKSRNTLESLLKVDSDLIDKEGNLNVKIIHVSDSGELHLCLKDESGKIYDDDRYEFNEILITNHCADNTENIKELVKYLETNKTVTLQENVSFTDVFFSNLPSYESASISKDLKKYVGKFFKIKLSELRNIVANYQLEDLDKLLEYKKDEEIQVKIHKVSDNAELIFDIGNYNGEEQYFHTKYATANKEAIKSFFERFDKVVTQYPRIVGKFKKVFGPAGKKNLEVLKAENSGVNYWLWRYFKKFVDTTFFMPLNELKNILDNGEEILKDLNEGDVALKIKDVNDQGEVKLCLKNKEKSSFTIRTASNLNDVKPIRDLVNSFLPVKEIPAVSSS